jgi:RNA polymerase sigma-70 factor (ECF subfamily)
MGNGAHAPEVRESLLARIKDARDAPAWQAFVTTFAPAVYAYGRRRGFQDADAADFTQEVLAEVARCIRTFEYQPWRGPFRAWLRTVTRRRLVRFRQRLRRRTAVALCATLEERVAAQAGPGWADEYHVQILAAALRRARPHFTATTWRAFVCVWLDDRPAADAAAELGVPVEAVYVAKSRVLKRLEREVRELAADFPQPARVS